MNRIFALLILSIFSSAAFALDMSGEVESCQLEGHIRLMGHTQIVCSSSLVIKPGTEIQAGDFKLTIRSEGNIGYGTHPDELAPLDKNRFVTIWGSNVVISAPTCMGFLKLNDTSSRFSGEFELDCTSRFEYSDALNVQQDSSLRVILGGQLISKL